MRRLTLAMLVSLCAAGFVAGCVPGPVPVTTTTVPPPPPPPAAGCYAAPPGSVDFSGDPGDALHPNTTAYADSTDCTGANVTYYELVPASTKQDALAACQAAGFDAADTVANASYYLVLGSTFANMWVCGLP